MSDDELKVATLKFDHEFRLYEARMRVVRVVLGTMVVGIAAAAFPFASQYAQVVFQERIEQIKADAQINIDARANELELRRLERGSEIDSARMSEESAREMRTFLNDLGSEGRSADIEARIRLAEYFSFVGGSENEREQWTAFREYLVKLAEERREERKRLREIELDENADPVAKLLASEGILSIDRELAPSRTATGPAATGFWMQVVPFSELGIDPRSVNGEVRPLRNETLLSILGRPRADVSDVCTRPTEPRILGLLETRSVGPFQSTMLRPALASLTTIMEEIRVNAPELYPLIGTAGATCVRLVRGSSSRLSDYSWGTAIDLTIAGQMDRSGDQSVQRGLARIAPYFISQGWHWGASSPIEASMRFSVGEDLFLRWNGGGQLESSQRPSGPAPQGSGADYLYGDADNAQADE